MRHGKGGTLATARLWSKVERYEAAAGICGPDSRLRVGLRVGLGLVARSEPEALQRGKRMVWRNCSECTWSYNDTKGGCRNSACAKFDPNSLSGGGKSSGNPSLAHQPPGINPVPTFGAPKNAGIPKSTGIPKNTGLPKNTGVTPGILAPDVVPDTPIVPWIQTSPQQSERPGPKGAPKPAEAFTLVCYRGEKSEWWPEPRMRLAGGMRVFEPWPNKGDGIQDIWDQLVKEVRKQPGFNAASKAAAYAQYLRATGRPFALASARTTGGAFEGYSYVIEIEGARTFRWGKDCTLGPPANFTNTNKTTYTKMVNQNREVWTQDTIDADYIVLNADSIAESTILGFGQKTGTYEVTFLHDLPLRFVKTVNGVAPAALGIYAKEAIEKMPDSKHKQTALKLFR